MRVFLCELLFCLRQMPRSTIIKSYSRCMFSFFKNCQTVSRIKIPKATYAWSSFSASLLKFGVVTIFNYFDVCTVIAHCGFNIYAPRSFILTFLTQKNNSSNVCSINLCKRFPGKRSLYIYGQSNIFKLISTAMRQPKKFCFPF